MSLTTFRSENCKTMPMQFALIGYADGAEFYLRLAQVYYGVKRRELIERAINLYYRARLPQHARLVKMELQNESTQIG